MVGVRFQQGRTAVLDSQLLCCTLGLGLGLGSRIPESPGIWDQFQGPVPFSGKESHPYFHEPLTSSIFFNWEQSRPPHGYDQPP